MRLKSAILFFFICSITFGQQNLQWKGYFSYNKIGALAEDTNKLFAASENAIFSNNLATNQINITNTINGLSGETITAMHHSKSLNRTIVGYQNGLLIVMDNVTGSLTKVVDIINKNIPANIKRVNHFHEHNSTLYISCDFGIVQYNFNTLEFGDTYFIGPNGQEIKIFETTVFNNEIYAVTRDFGIKKASISNPNLIDFNQWQTFDSGFWNAITHLGNNLVASNTNGRLYKSNGTFFEEILNQNQASVALKMNDNFIISTTTSRVFILNSGLSMITSIQNSSISSIPLTFSCATIINNRLFIGTNENGVITAPLSNLSEFEVILPDGPLRNNIFSMHLANKTIWAVYGGYNILYNPYQFIGFTLTSFGYSKYSDSTWTNFPFEEMLGAKSLSRIISNPNNPNLVYISSYNNGLLKVENDIPNTLYNETNSSLRSIVSGSTENIRIGPGTFARNGDFWVTNSRVKNGLHVLKNGTQWQSYNMENILSNFSGGDFSRILIDNVGVKWMGTYLDGVVAFNENGSVFKKITEGVEQGNLPSSDVRALAIDQRNQVWIGTRKGLRVLSSTGSFNNETQMRANPIIIIEDDLPQELLFEQFITDIEIDGSNRKWIATADSGVFLFSPNGQETIYHFTINNSPLPSNTVNDVAINGETGEVFFATPRGMISFQGTATTPAANLKDVYVYPNPVRPGFTGTVKITELVSKANIKITDIEGNLVYETTSTGGTIEWDTTAFGKYKVASGVYMIFIASEDGSDTTVKKVMIIR